MFQRVVEGDDVEWSEVGREIGREIARPASAGTSAGPFSPMPISAGSRDWRLRHDGHSGVVRSCRIDRPRG